MGLERRSQAAQPWSASPSTADVSNVDCVLLVRARTGPPGNNASSDWLPSVLNHAEACGMPYLYDRSLVVWSFPFLIFLSGCSDKLECDSIETRKAVLQMVADDHRNPLANYAAKNPTAKANLENAKPLYLLGQRIVTTSTSQDKRTLQCSGEISVSVGDTKASKEVDFTVQQLLDGKISVSVVPFQF
jgi:hypothetical protein